VGFVLLPGERQEIHEKALQQARVGELQFAQALAGHLAAVAVRGGVDVGDDSLQDVDKGLEEGAVGVDRVDVDEDGCRRHQHLPLEQERLVLLAHDVDGAANELEQPVLVVELRALVLQENQHVELHDVVVPREEREKGPRHHRGRDGQPLARLDPLEQRQPVGGRGRHGERQRVTERAGGVADQPI
jgi:hypothetical protein